MKYNKVEVLKDLPDVEKGVHPLQDSEKKGGRQAFLEGSEFFYLQEFLESRPDFFRLIEEPEFKVGGYASPKEPFKFFTYTYLPTVVYQITDVNYSIRTLQLTGDGNVTTFSFDEVIGRQTSEYLKQEEEKKPWRPELGELYYYLASDGEIQSYHNEGSKIGAPHDDVVFGNCFRTKEAAEYYLQNYRLPADQKYAQDIAAGKVPTDKR